ncbi:DUF2474 domain-containing protein [Photobacterium sp. WH77]|nr:MULTISPECIES: DUF2474 domain-containing protein [unclassified Photobacterium]MBV7261678.1 DUF2474 domain-containing protein [Photobacterium sp. WH24]MCG2836062.1 DUF2474 domain-containing protein [Photobacterium sp. WH77]MCG2843803.1 DUF2474 domain-containing protein [Photobacterium sp. WH80]MDO6581202.1 DUF2474 domain-containing protein [Photobacterium sp. 2_MG-2023]
MKMMTDTLKQYGWMVLIWSISVAALTCISWLFRALMTAAGLTV